MKALPTKEELESMHDTMRDDIVEFRDDNINFKSEFEKQNEIIRRYDEVLTQKASKLNLEDYNSQLNDKLKRHMNQFMRNVERLEKKQSNYE